MSRALAAVGVLLVFLAFGFLINADLARGLGCAMAGAILCAASVAWDSEWARFE